MSVWTTIFLNDGLQSVNTVLSFLRPLSSEAKHNNHSPMEKGSVDTIGLQWLSSSLASDCRDTVLTL